MAIVLIGFGLYGFWQRYSTTHSPQPVIPTEAVTHTTDHPDETPPGDTCKNHTVAAQEPRYIEISRLDITGCVQKVGIDQHNAIAAPTNVHLAGWYTGSVLPGEKGVSIIDGHVRGRYSDAIFGNLKNAVKGDTIRLQRGDKTWLTFKVADVAHYPADDAMPVLFDQLPDVDSQLTLITCSGRYDTETATYDQRIIVRAVLQT